MADAQALLRFAEIYQRAAARFASTSLATLNAAAVGSRPETSVGKNSQRLKKIVDTQNRRSYCTNQ
ncbi:hypothetical protein AGR1B_pAt30109 [Agrobacterium fabacearum S56]|nr:hypothetical protein AGR1B_pAt30109 [Agrobacterium fabacearum S56]